MNDERETCPQSERKAPVVLRVIEGLRRSPAGREGCPTSRTFSVVLSGPCDDLGVVAVARDPTSGLEVPRPGSRDPADRTLVARPPMVYSVGLKAKGGALIAARSNFYNVRVNYVRDPAPGDVEAPHGRD